jgi:putative ABC transport system permease protein
MRSISRNRMRSFLTALGIIIGVGSVIIMLGVGQGTQRSIRERLAALGTNLLQVQPARQRFRPGQAMMRVRVVQISQTDLETIHRDASYARYISGVVTGSFTEVGTTGTDDITVTGCEPSYAAIKSMTIADGQMFGQEDLDNRNDVAVLGSTTAATLFGSSAKAIDQVMRVGTTPVTVIGVFAQKADEAGSDTDDMLWMPLTTVQYQLLNKTNVNSIAVSVVSADYMTAEQRELTSILRETHKIQPAPDGSYTDDFQILNSADMIATADSILGVLTTLLAAIAGVSLLVGGIGIMNIMLVSVTERTREIGIRMAVGARKRDILLQFLSESAFLSLLGGIAGVALAFGVCAVLGRFKINTYISPVVVLIAVAFSAVVGIFFGFYPARKAASLYPIDALRYE